MSYLFRLVGRISGYFWVIPFIASVAVAACGETGAGKAALTIKTLSNRADLVSGGDVLMEVSGFSNPSQIRIRAGDRDVTSVFQSTSDGKKLIGLITGLAVGDTLVTAAPSNGKGAEIVVTNHELTGPIFSGEQTQPWTCTAETVGLEPSELPHCMSPTLVEFFYRTVFRTWAAYSQDNPPLDMAMTTTDQGKTVPFIVRQETGTMNRAVYSFAVLWDPLSESPGWISPGAWNGKALFNFGEGAQITHSQGTLAKIESGKGQTAPAGPNSPDMLGRGFAVGAQSMGVGANNTNDVVSAETLMMLKERMIETLGPIRYSLGYGVSGGSINQNMINAAYPGLLDGSVKGAEMVDWYTVGLDSVDCGLLENYFDNTSPTMWLNLIQRTAVLGGSPTNCRVIGGLIGDNFFGPKSCDMEWAYDPVSNPTGARCTLQDNNVAAFGRRSPEQWGPVEKQIGRGFAHRPLDNVGVQYGLEALQSGEISIEQFVDMNEKIGGYDIDFNFVPSRMLADPEALTVLYRTGRLSLNTNLERVPMISQGGEGNAYLHADFRSHQVIGRLKASHGTAENYILHKKALGTDLFDPSIPELDFNNPLHLMDRWLSAIEADGSDRFLVQKVVANKPQDIVNQCFVGPIPITDPALCNTLYPITKPPRAAAGGPLDATIWKCQTRPLNRDDYKAVGSELTDELWARLEVVFPQGVCDWNQTGVGYEPNIPWMSFRSGPYGVPLGAAPVSKSQ